MKQQRDMVDIMLAHGDIKQFNKFGIFDIRLAVTGEKIDTIIDGILETTNVAKMGDLVVKGVSGEFYIIDNKKLKSRYRYVSGTIGFTSTAKYKATGVVYGFKYDGYDMWFIASWGERMLLTKGDYLVTTDKTLKSDIYRIEQRTFLKTFRPG